MVPFWIEFARKDLALVAVQGHDRREEVRGTLDALELEEAGLEGIQDGFVGSYRFQECLVLVVVQDDIGTAALSLRQQGYGGVCIAWTLHGGSFYKRDAERLILFRLLYMDSACVNLST